MPHLEDTNENENSHKNNLHHNHIKHNLSEEENKEIEFVDVGGISHVDHLPSAYIEDFQIHSDEVSPDETKNIVPRTTSYDKRKSIAHGMMDTALITANANQLKFIINYYKGNETMLMILIILVVSSLVIQVFVGFALIFRHKKKKRNDLTGEVEVESNSGWGITMDEFIIAGVFIVIIINIFIAAFSGDSFHSEQ